MIRIEPWLFSLQPVTLAIWSWITCVIQNLTFLKREYLFSNRDPEYGDNVQFMNFGFNICQIQCGMLSHIQQILHYITLHLHEIYYHFPMFDKLTHFHVLHHTQTYM